MTLSYVKIKMLKPLPYINILPVIVCLRRAGGMATDRAVVHLEGVPWDTTKPN
jgi:hypothetical protein